MNPQDPLANLHPLREPPLIDWWPPAPGWWLLLICTLLGIMALGYFLIRRFRANAYRRRALAQLQDLHEKYMADSNTGQYIGETNALLKSVAILAYPRRQVAASSGEEWRSFLNSKMQTGEQFPENFFTAAYQKVCPEMDMALVHRAAQRWIKQHEAAR